MNISKQRRVYAGILGLAVAAWAGDRFILSRGPDAATAAAIAEDLAVPHAGPGAGGANAALHGAGLAERLDDLGQTRQFPGVSDDAFLVPPDWQPEAARAKAEEAVRPRFDADAFVKAHRLTAVMFNKADASRSAAVVDGGMIVRPGESLGESMGGVTLREVTAEKAVFERDGVIVELRIERGGSAGRTDGKVGGASENGGVGGQGG